MTDTAFWADPARVARLAALYTPGAEGRAARLDSVGRLRSRSRPCWAAAAAGLTAADYHGSPRCCCTGRAALRGLDGVRLLSPRTWPT